MLPTLLFSTILGEIVDKFSRLTIFRVSRILRLVVALLYLIVIVLGYKKILFFISSLTGTIIALEKILSFVLIKETTDNNMIAPANTLMEISRILGTILGTSLGGIVLHTYGLKIILIICSILAFLPIILTLEIKFKTINSISNNLNPKFWPSKEHFSLFGSYLKDANFAKISVARSSSIMIRFILPLMLPLLFRETNMGCNLLGFMEALCAIGTIIGSFTMNEFHSSRFYKPILLGKSSLLAICLVIFPQISSLNIMLFIYFIFGLCLSIQTSLNSDLQYMIKKQHQGQVSSIIFAVEGLITTTIYGLIAVFGKFLSFHFNYYFISCFALICFITLLSFHPLKYLEKK